MRILGLDLGVGSVGWALIELADPYAQPLLIDAGSRIIPLTPDVDTQFNTGKGVTPCQKRTMKRTMRRTNSRFKQRRYLLQRSLAQLNMLPSSDLNISLSPLEIWGMRAKAATPGEILTLPQLGRVLLHINSKRGYRHSRLNKDTDAKDTEYVQQIMSNYDNLRADTLTVGQFLYRELKKSEAANPNGGTTVSFRTKGIVFPRQAYEEEFNLIMQHHMAAYPEILTPDVVENLRHHIFYQRPLKSCKHLVNICEFEGHEYTTTEGRKVFGGPKVAPRTSPLSQICRIYEAVNNIRLINLKNKGKKNIKVWTASLFDEGKMPRDARLLQEEYILNSEERQKIVDYLNVNEKLTASNLLKLLGLKKSDGFIPNQAVIKGLKGNSTYIALKNALIAHPELEKELLFKLEIVDSDRVNVSTGEILPVVASTYIDQPLYRLWHLLYSISDPKELEKNLMEKYAISDRDTITRLSAIDFRTPGYSNKSARFMRRLLPFLMEGQMYSQACESVEINHSDSLTKEENSSRPLAANLSPLQPKSLRQPLVEKILQQMINVVNAIIDNYGPIDEARVELARPLKQTAEKRANTTAENKVREKENLRISEILQEHGLTPSRARIQKYKLWVEAEKRCMYCNKCIGIIELLASHDGEVEHIIPRSLYFDDSFVNKTCACSRCNKEKNNRTAYTYMASKGSEMLDNYVAKVERLFTAKSISPAKRKLLLTEQENIPTDFVERDMRETQYISKKARFILREAIRDVWSSSGAVTSFLRHVWGYDNILHDINLDRFHKAGLTEERTYEHKGQIHTRIIIKDWDKRRDHRHHAVDALVIAQTRQAYIQRLTNMNTQRDGMLADILANGAKLSKDRLLIQWGETLPHIPVAEIMDRLLRMAVSTKREIKLATPGKRKYKTSKETHVVQEGLLIPRRPLHEESIYGKIVTKKDNIAGKVSEAEEFVIRRDFQTLEPKQVETQIGKIVDGKIRQLFQQRYEECGKDARKFQTSLKENPIRLNENQASIKAVRCYTGYKSSSMAAPRKDATGAIIGYAKKGDNDHVAYYSNGKKTPDCIAVSSWTAIHRRLYGLPVEIVDPRLAVDKLMEIENEDIREMLAQDLPHPDSKHLLTLRKGQIFILGLSDEEIEMAKLTGDMALLSDHIYRVQAATVNDIVFRLHTDTSSERLIDYDKAGNWKRIKSYGALLLLNPKEIKIDTLGKLYV